MLYLLLVADFLPLNELFQVIFLFLCIWHDSTDKAQVHNILLQI